MRYVYIRLRYYIPSEMTEKTVLQLRARILAALSDPIRLELLDFLSGQERCVCEILPAFTRSH